MRIILNCTVAIAACVASAAGAQSHTYPNKPIRLIIPFSAGGPSDVLGRALARQLSESFGQPVTVENRTGAGGNIGIDAVAKSAPDGYTIGMGHTGSFSINPHIYAKMPYDSQKDFAPITPVVSYANVLVCNPKVPATSVAELVAWSKANPQAATYASGGNGATNHLSGELLKSLTGASLMHIPYKGNAPAMLDVVAGNVSCMFDIPTTAIPQIRAGKVRPLAITSPKRSTHLPSVPTMREAGVPGYEEAGNDLWFGFVAPAGTPQAIVDRWNTATVKALQSRELQETVHQMAYEVWTMPSTEFRGFLRTDLMKWGKVVKLSGAKVE